MVKYMVAIRDEKRRKRRKWKKSNARNLWGEKSSSDEQKGTKAFTPVERCKKLLGEFATILLAVRQTPSYRPRDSLRHFSNRTKRLMNFTLFLVDDDFDGEGASKGDRSWAKVRSDRTLKLRNNE